MLQVICHVSHVPFEPHQLIIPKPPLLPRPPPADCTPVNCAADGQWDMTDFILSSNTWL